MLGAATRKLMDKLALLGTHHILHVSRIRVKEVFAVLCFAVYPPSSPPHHKSAVRTK